MLFQLPNVFACRRFSAMVVHYEVVGHYTVVFTFGSHSLGPVVGGVVCLLIIKREVIDKVIVYLHHAVNNLKPNRVVNDGVVSCYDLVPISV